MPPPRVRTSSFAVCVALSLFYCPTVQLCMRFKELEAVVGLRIWNENDIQRGQEAGCNVNVILILLLPHSFRCGWPSLRACKWKDGLPKSSHPVLFFYYSLNTSRTEFFMLVAFAYWGLISICMYLIHRLTSIPPDSQGSCLVLLGVSMYSKPGWQNLSLFFFFSI